jgi:hypothetical protein
MDPCDEVTEMVSLCQVDGGAGQGVNTVCAECSAAASQIPHAMRSEADDRHAAAFDHATRLIMDAGCVLDDRGAWSEHLPTAAQENQFIDTHGYGEYARWQLDAPR